MAYYFPSIMFSYFPEIQSTIPIYGDCDQVRSRDELIKSFPFKEFGKLGTSTFSGKNLRFTDTCDIDCCHGDLPCPQRRRSNMTIAEVLFSNITSSAS